MICRVLLPFVLLGSLVLPVDAGMVEHTAEIVLHPPLSPELVESYLQRWNIKELRREGDATVFRLRYNERNHDFRLRIAAERVLIIRLENLFHLPRNHLRFTAMLAELMAENYRLTVGKFTWDARDGEVGVEHAIVAARGLAYEDFIDVMVRLLLTADRKYPELMRSMWR